ncbi:MAG: metallophosphoesterase family protein [Lentisphaeria bacterium]|nr:metallophosphoesterase family protein [Lentisphaeria bacterium]
MTVAPDTPLVVLSDLHLGSPYTRPGLIESFLERLRDGTVLVLNGDTFDSPPAPGAPPVPGCAALRRAASRLRLIAVEGNHDGRSAGDAIEGAECTDEVYLPGRLVAFHGHRVDRVLPSHRLFIRFFGWFHGVRLRLGAADVHVAEYAKRWRWAYRYLVREQRRQAVRHGRERGVGAVACGHVHWAEDTVEEGIRYLNSGAWTEEPVYCIPVTAGGMELVDVRLVVRGGAVSTAHAEVFAG